MAPSQLKTSPALPVFALAAEDDTTAATRGLTTPTRPQAERMHYTTPVLGGGTATAVGDPFSDPYCDASIRELWLRRQQLDLLEQLCRQEEDMLLRRHQEQQQQRRASCFSVASTNTDYADPTAESVAPSVLPPPPLLERVVSCQPHMSRRRAELDVEDFDQVLRLGQAGVGAPRQGRRASLPLLFSAVAPIANDAAACGSYADNNGGAGAGNDLGDEFGLVSTLYNAPAPASLLRRESAPLPFLPQTTPTLGAGAVSLALVAAAAATPAQAAASLAFSPPPRHARERTRSADPLLFGGTRLSLSSGGGARTLRRASVQWNAYDDDGLTDEAEELSRLYTDVSMSAMGTPTVATTFDSGLSDVGDEELSQRTVGGRKTRSGTSAAAAAAAAAAREKHPLHKTELCRSWEETGSCRYGSKCQFAHSQQELRTVKRHPKWRTKRCKTFWTEGTCPYGKRCGFIHHPDDQAPSAGDSATDVGSSSPMDPQQQHHHQHQQQMLLPVTPPPPMDASGTLPGTPSPAPSAVAAAGGYSMLATPPQLLPFVLPPPEDPLAFAAATAAAAAVRTGVSAPPLLPTSFVPDTGSLKPPPFDCSMGGTFPAGGSIGNGGGACVQRIAFELPFDGKQPPMPYGYSHVPPAAGPLVPGQPPPHGFLVGPPPQPQPQHRQQLQLHQAQVMPQMMPPPLPPQLGIGPPPFACPPPPLHMPPPPPTAAGHTSLGHVTSPCQAVERCRNLPAFGKILGRQVEATTVPDALDFDQQATAAAAATTMAPAAAPIYAVGLGASRAISSSSAAFSSSALRAIACRVARCATGASLRLGPSAVQRLGLSGSTKASATGTGIPTLDIDAYKRSRELNRPLSPQLQIYQPQLTWVMSAWHRLTGVAVGGAFYLAAMAYAIAPVSSTTIAAGFTALPFIVKFFAKALITVPIVYHSFNGIRHLVWDWGSGLTLKSVYSSGYTVLALTGAVSLVICLL
ncbi:cytochrome b subunit of succinate dehydrogenase, Sdh3p [Cladochytrium tenue]|nr:cytochrome b subunit of succinate dehydrogenase, Sdh3p [Cladochytrium tenue]